MASIAVVGMWHLGSVTAACLASAGHQVIAIDDDADVIRELTHSRAPLAEPGLDTIIARESAAGRLRFSTRIEEVQGCDILWIAYDTSVDESDVADVEFVHQRSLRALDHIRDEGLFVMSSQVPVGSIARIEREFASSSNGRHVHFASAPENLRLGRAVEVFLQPDRVVLGTRDAEAKAMLQAVYAPFTDRIEWMSVESAEMTKHAINAFLATSICFINEIAAISESTGADVAEVERGLKTDQRIGTRAYLRAGEAIAGGTLLRDLSFLRSLGCQANTALPLIEGAQESNREHKDWLRRKIVLALGGLTEKRVAILGLTYKAGTNTLRRSAAVEIARWLHENGAEVHAFDPQIPRLPAELNSILSLSSSPAEALTGADALLVMTPWPEFRSLNVALAPPVIFDPARFLEDILGMRDNIRYYAIGRAH